MPNYSVQIFCQKSVRSVGICNLGDYTPETQKDQLCGHALILMFQSFAGKHVQAIGCFLPKGNVLGAIQAKLVLEAVNFCETAAVYVDVVTADGATWNRAMWKSFNAGNPEAP